MITHGMTKTGTYSSWENMISRTTEGTAAYKKDFENYGARGISVCLRWKKFKNFLEDMGIRPNNHSIDRIDNNKGYSKENCRWATREQQARNKRNSVNITIGNRTLSLLDWLKETGSDIDRYYYRIGRGMSRELAVSHKERLYVPVCKPEEAVKMKKSGLNNMEISKKLNCSIRSVYRALSAGRKK